MDVTFETTQGFRFTLEIWYFATVMEMKEDVRRYAGIPVEFQRLFFHGRELEDHRDAEHYSILHGSHVLIVLPTPVRIVLHVDAGTVAVDDVDVGSCTVARLKELVQQLTDGAVLAARISLFFDEVEMEDGEVLAEYFKEGGDHQATKTMEVRVVVRDPPAPEKKVSLEVKWGRRTATVEVSDMTVVRELMAVLPEYDGDGDGYFFMYKEMVMEEEQTLRWHDVKDGDTVEIFNGSATPDDGASSTAD